jgi:predicted nuclease with TOPRIM domain
MIKSPKEFYKMFQDNEEFIKLMKELNELKLNIEFVIHSGDTEYNSFFIKIFNDKYSAGEDYQHRYYLLENKEYYEKELKELRNKAETDKFELGKIEIFKNKDKYDIKELKDKLNSLFDKIESKEVFLGLRSKRMEKSTWSHPGEEYTYSIDGSTYDEKIKYNKKFIMNVLKNISDLIHEYKSIKFCTEDIILY